MESENAAKLVNTTYRNVIDDLGPCIKQLVGVGRIYLKSIHGMLVAGRNYNETLNKVALMADNTTLRGSTDIGAALHHIVDINRELQAQQSNIMKSLEFDFLEAMEIAADKDTKLIGREHKRFLQMHKTRKEDYEKSISTLKKSRRKKGSNADKQLAQMKLTESTKLRLEEFCDESLKEAIVQERIMYGTVLERQTAFNKQLVIYFHKGCDLLQDSIPHWDILAESRNALPRHCSLATSKSPKKSDSEVFTIGGNMELVESPVESLTLRRQLKAQHRRTMIVDPRLEDGMNGIYARPMVRSKSDHNLTTIADSNPVSRCSRLVEYNGDLPHNYVRVVYPYQPRGEHEMTIAQEDIIRFSGPPGTSGWQFGENLSTRGHGWFPLSYTEFLDENEDSPASSRGSTLVDGDYAISKKRTTVTTNSRIDIKTKSNFGQAAQSDSSDYGTLKRSTNKKAVPVQPPELPATNRGNSQSESHPNIIYSSENDAKKRTLYLNPPLKSVHL